MKKNIGTLDSWLRITGGLYMLGTGIIEKDKLMLTIGSMKVAEGITRFCPILYSLGLSTIEDPETCDILPENFFSKTCKPLS